MPDVAISQQAAEVDFPLSAANLSLSDLADRMQHAAGVVAWTSTILAALDSKVSYLKDKVQEGSHVATVGYRRKFAEEIKNLKLAADEVRAQAVEEDPTLKESIEELRRAQAEQKRYERLLEAWQTIRNTYSRQITIRGIELEPR